VANREITKIVVHCSDSPDHRDFGLVDIDRWHKERGFTGTDIGPDKPRIYCGYHYVIRRNGLVEVGRPEWAIGAHCHLHNYDSIGVCWIGRDKITTEQMISLMDLLKVIARKYALVSGRVHGHYEFNSGKTCPNLDMVKIRESLKILLGE
jgi:N-acetylmuramoyl-L-alanine amidase